MRLQQYFVWVESMLFSRRDAEVEEFTVREIEPDRAGVVEGRLRFWDGSLLRFAESLTVRGVSLVKQRYAYHFQDSAGHLLFRYDNVPHHPGVPTHPHHKHVGDPAHGTETIVGSTAPDLSAVLREIDRRLHQ